MYRATPLTYFVKSFMSDSIAGAQIQCAPHEVISIHPPSGQAGPVYLEAYLSQAKGRLLNPGATAKCQYCSIAESNDVLAGLDIRFNDRSWNWGISMAYILINIILAQVLYRLFKVSRGSVSKDRARLA